MPSRMTERKKKLKRYKASSEEFDSSSMSSSLTSSSDDETDAKNLKPIKEYLSNRKELASQLFKSVKADKIRMMLPQVLKKVEFTDLEELCATELIGMSKPRILSIINGHEMQQSSNTEDSDDSGPSLEIISDTEWLSEEETNIKVEGATSKNSKDAKRSKKKIQNSKLKLKSKGKGKLGKDGKPGIKVKLEKVKTEAKEKEKQKEGESLLDLLELEMRARAIRALIRKEEDSSNSNSKNPPTNNSSNAASGSGITNDKNARQVNLKEQLEKIDVLMKHGEDEDVFVVINPAPTIELLSSESENEDNSKRVNHKLVNERKSESEKLPGKVQSDKTQGTNNDIIKNKNPNKEKDKTTEKDIVEEPNKMIEKNVVKEKSVVKEKNKIENNKTIQNINNKVMQKQNGNSCLPISVTESSANDKSENASEPLKEVDLEEGEIIDNDEEEVINKETQVNSDSSSPSKIKKVKKNPHIRPRKKNRENNDDSMDSDESMSSKKNASHSGNEKSSSKNEPLSTLAEPIEIEDSPKRADDTNKVVEAKENTVDNSSKVDLFDDKSLDIEEIINLDDYPDDMDDLERIEDNKERKDINKAGSKSKETEKATSSIGGSRSETWATRYYQQDDVQNVIKESKIQSEIRKRLRERQRQNKLNNSPKLKEPEVAQPSPEPIIPKPTGSVEEYLALKAISSETISDIAEEKIDTTEVLESTKIDESPLVDNNHTTVQEIELPSDKIIETKSNLSRTNSKVSNKSAKIKKKAKLAYKIKAIDKSAVIVKKAKLADNIAIIKKVDAGLNENIALQLLNKVLRCDESFPNTKDDCAKNLPLSDEKNIVFQNESLLDNAEAVVKLPEEPSEQMKQMTQVEPDNKINNSEKDSLPESEKNIVAIKSEPPIHDEMLPENVNEDFSDRIEPTKTSNIKKEVLSPNKIAIKKEISPSKNKKNIKKTKKKLMKKGKKIKLSDSMENDSSLNLNKMIKAEEKVDGESDSIKEESSILKDDSRNDNAMLETDSKQITLIKPQAIDQIEEALSSDPQTSELRPD